MAATEVILLERVDKLGAMGEVVSVKPGYARNFLLPQGKALRATTANRAYFEAERTALEAANAQRRDAAAKRAEALDGLMVSLVRQAGERGQLYGSVAARDIAEALSAEAGEAITKGQVALDANIRTIGLFEVEIVLHPEVRVAVTVNVARTPAEAELQAKTGRAAIATEEEDAPAPESATPEVAGEAAPSESEAAAPAEPAEEAAGQPAEEETKA
jgi:large subunit ribosomal protein L9